MEIGVGTGVFAPVHDAENPLEQHERVLFGQHPRSGLRAIIAVHSTALGPALGGTRFYPYKSEAAALADVLRLSRGMTFKAAAAGLHLGGGKAVIIGDPDTTKTPDLLRAYGDLVDSLHGDYVTAADLGTTAQDMDVVGSRTAHVVGRTRAHGGSGSTAHLTAKGVFSAMTAAAEHVWGTASLAGRVVGVEGVGKVGSELVRLLVNSDAVVIVTDVDRQAVDRVTLEYANVEATETLSEERLDVYAPCALGGTLTSDRVPAMTAAIVCGAANNQLSELAAGEALFRRGIVWVPDFVANAGGLIQAAAELDGLSHNEMEEAVAMISSRTRELLTYSATHNLSPHVAATHVAEQRVIGAVAPR